MHSVHPPSAARRKLRLHLVAALLANLLGACATVTTTATAVIADKPVAYARHGDQRPTIVLQSGLGDGRAPWNKVFLELQTRHSVFAYDRPGYGGSPFTSGPRDPCSVATELHALLAAAGLKPPYILVGHSLGGLYQYVFARLYPEDTAALVLLDPTHPVHWETMQREAPQSAAVVKALRATLFSAAARQEFDDQARCLDRFDLSVPLQAPTQILVSTRFPPPHGEEFRKMIGRLREDWLRLTGAAANVPVAGSGHYLQRDATPAVVQAIEYAISHDSAP